MSFHGRILTGAFPARFFKFVRFFSLSNKDNSLESLEDKKKVPDGT